MKKCYKWGKKMEQFFKFLEKTSLEKDEINGIKFFYEYLNGRHNPKLSSKILVLTGEAGVGKTHLAKQLIHGLDLTIYYVGQEELSGKNIIKLSSLAELEKRADLSQDCLVFCDDLIYLADETEFGEMSNYCKKIIFRILAKVKSSRKRVGFLATLNYLHLDDQIVDRFDIVINVEPPLRESKESFLRCKYGEYLTKSQVKYLSRYSVGYNFRDIDEVVRRSYRHGSGFISKESVQKALKEYKPPVFRQFDILKSVEVNFKDVIGREGIKRKLMEVMIYYNNKDKLKGFGLKRTNLLIFHGKPGVGKTYVAKAFAGEIGFPLVNIRAQNLYRYGPIMSFDNISKFARRFKDCVIFIDEADKLLGRPLIGEDGPVQGMLNEFFEGVRGINDTIIILSMNKISNFGEAFHDRFTIILFDNPNQRERMDYFKARVKAHKKIFSKNMDFDRVSRITKRMSFRDMENVWNRLVFQHLNTNKKISMKCFEQCVKTLPKEEDFLSMFG